jgi:hypothetical protein
MTNEAARSWRADPTAGRTATVSGIIATPLKDVGALFERLTDALIAARYLA